MARHDAKFSPVLFRDPPKRTLVTPAPDPIPTPADQSYTSETTIPAHDRIAISKALKSTPQSQVSSKTTHPESTILFHHPRPPPYANFAVHTGVDAEVLSTLHCSGRHAAELHYYCLFSGTKERRVKPNEVKKSELYEFKIDGDILYAPRVRMKVNELIQIALDAKVLEPVEGGYTLEDGKGNELPNDQFVDLDKQNVFYATEQEPGPASWPIPRPAPSP